MTDDRRRRAWKILSLLGVVAAVATLGLATDLVETVRDRERLRDTVDDAGFWGPIAYVALFVSLQPVLLIPSVVFVLPAAVLWPSAVAIPIVVVAGTMSSMVSVAFARTVGRSWVQRRLPPRLRAWDERLARGSVFPVVLLRTITYLGHPPSWILGLSQMPWTKILFGTALGLVLPTAIWIFVGDNMLAYAVDNPAIVMALVGAGVAAAVGHRRRRRLNLTSTRLTTTGGP